MYTNVTRQSKSPTLLASTDISLDILLLLTLQANDKLHFPPDSQLQSLSRIALSGTADATTLRRNIQPSFQASIKAARLTYLYAREGSLCYLV